MLVKELKSNHLQSINIISEWYQQEWDIPIEKTRDKLLEQNSKEHLFQLIAEIDGKLTGSVGFGLQVNLLNVHPKFIGLGPWVSVLYVDEAFRGQGIAQRLLADIEERARLLGHTNIFIYTFTAEQLYLRCGWEEIDRVPYKDHDTCVLKKKI